ncbi:MAG: DegT/DnrJ/EryC1/StrS family aminotransferase [Solirubrobacterales bacterium]|nr:DegT/DnrJ/EryC1/StrS family aminotransferase [Solirubrobacterales bacterium]
MIPLFDLRFEPEDLEAVAETLRSGWLTQGPRVAALEAAFAETLGRAHAVAVSSCTAALHLAYRAVGVGPGDEVIVPSYTFVATANAVLYCGATPVFADILGIEDPSLDPEDVARKITPRTKAVAAVHFGGYAAPVDALASLCEEHGLALIEDAAHAPSASLHGRSLGAWGTAGCFSFFSNKVLPVGEGGLLATDDDSVAASARAARSHCMSSGTWERHTGRTDTYDVAGLGLNYRLDEPRAALLLSRLPRLPEEIARRQVLTRAYRRRLAGLDALVLPFRDDQVAESSCYILPVMLREPGRQAEVRRRLMDAHGVQTSIMYPAIHEFSAYRERFPGVSLPHTERAARAEICLPLFAHLTEGEQERVILALEEALS